MNPLVSLLPLVIFILFLRLELYLLQKARSSLKLVIRVTGTRGKSSVTRMIHALLCEAGYTAWAKTTGTEARRLMADSREITIRRYGPGNIREQRNTVIRAARAGADALILECNAVKPSLMAAAGTYSREDLLVITNVRDDHRTEQGDPHSAAVAMIRSAPPGATVITADTVRSPLYTAESNRRGGRCILVDTEEEGVSAVVTDEPVDNVACALAVAQWIGLPRERAIQAIRNYRRDPGSFTIKRWRDGAGRTLWFADALAANDPDSTALLLERTRAFFRRQGGTDPTSPAQCPQRVILVIAQRRDRPERAARFVRWVAQVMATAEGAGPEGAGPVNAGLPPFSRAVFVGPAPRAVRLMGGDRNGIAHGGVALLDRLVAEIPPGGSILFFGAGNWQGHGRRVRRWVERRAGERVSL